MYITTYNGVPGKEVKELKGIVSGDVVAGINFLKDIGASFRNIIGGRSKGYEGEIANARKEATEEIIAQAQSLGANAIVGLKYDYESLGQGGMLYVVVTGTAVVVE